MDVHTVLLAEDEEMLRATTALVLRRAGYRILEASTTESAYEIANYGSEQIHLLIADIGLPTIGGVQLFQEIAKSNAHLKGLFVSGYSAEAICDAAQLPTGTAFLSKPFEHSVLLETVRQLLFD